MADPAPLDASPPDAVRDELVDRLKKELAEKTEMAARADARASAYEAKERTRVSGFQPEAQHFFKEFLRDEIEAHHKDTTFAADVAPLAVWADEYTAKADIASQGALAAASYVASRSVKRLRDEASAGAKAAETLAATMKENEELKAANAKVAKDYAEAVALSEERQKGLSALQAELARAGLFADKFDFSKLTSREETSAEGAAPTEPHKAAGGATPALETVRAEASKAGMMANASRANPLEQGGGDLLTNLLSRSSGGLRVQASGTAHGFLGAQSSETTDIAAIIRATAA